MNNILKVKQAVENELHQFDETIRDILKNNNPLLNEVIDFVFNKNGKRIRPIIVFLSAKTFGEVNVQTISTAVALELLHTASLLHDDVVDESLLRRAQPSVNAMYDNKVSILAGDFFLASSLGLAIQTDNLHILRLFSSLGKDLAKGEIQQLNVSKQHIIDENVYIDVIRQKTAALFATCGSSGAVSVGATEEETGFFYQIGENLGIIFQIKDDIFDYYQSENVGKPTGNDIREGKITLPLIYALRENPCSEYHDLVENIQNHDFTDEDITKIVNFAKDNGGIEYAEQVMKKYYDLTLDLLSNVKNEEIKASFISLLDHLMIRTK
ncbi:MAG: polyprenyl synthetase family protein [Candidatus Azobacteroides sp.]|nr:polyprenyl synthetase family protein [Candidatus Azobacteroides sp.]